jgi:hypothetical protein
MKAMPRGNVMARKSVDSSALSAIASRPGVDTRVWLSLAIVKEIGFDAEHGNFVDVAMIPDGTAETCLLGTPYAGAQFGDHCPLEVDDVVLMAVPMGDPAQGPIIICRAHNKADPPHADFEGSNRVIRAKAGSNIKLVVSEGATVQIYAESGSTVRIGHSDELPAIPPGADGALNGEAIDPFTGTPYFALGQASSTVFVKK